MRTQRQSYSLVKDGDLITLTLFNAGNSLQTATIGMLVALVAMPLFYSEGGWPLYVSIAISIIFVYGLFFWYWSTGKRQIIIDRNHDTLTIKNVNFFKTRLQTLSLRDVKKIQSHSFLHTSEANSFWTSELRFFLSGHGNITFFLTYDDPQPDEPGKELAEFIGAPYEKLTRESFLWILIDNLKSFGFITILLVVFIGIGLHFSYSRYIREREITFQQQVGADHAQREYASSEEKICLLNNNPAVFTSEKNNIRTQSFPPLSKLQGLPKEYNTDSNPDDEDGESENNSLLLEANDHSQAYIVHRKEGPNLDVGTAPRPIEEEQFFLCEGQTKQCTKINGEMFSSETVGNAVGTANHGMPFNFQAWNREKSRFVVSWAYGMAPNNNLYFCSYHIDTKKYECPESLPARQYGGSISLPIDPTFLPIISPSSEKALLFTSNNEKSLALFYDLDNLKSPQRISLNATYRGNEPIFWFNKEQSLLILDIERKKIVRIDLSKSAGYELPIQPPLGFEPVRLSPSGRYLIMSESSDKNELVGKTIDLLTGEIRDIGIFDTNEEGTILRFRGASFCLQ